MKKSEKIKLLRGKSKTFVFANLTRQNVFPCAEKLVEILLKNKIEVYMVPKAAECISNPSVNFVLPEPKSPDKTITSPFFKSGAIFAPNASVSSVEFEITLHIKKPFLIYYFTNIVYQKRFSV